MSRSRFILLGVRRGEKIIHFYIHRLFQALSGNNWFNPASTPHSRWLAHPFAHVSPRHCLPRDRILWVRWAMSMGFRLGRVLPDGPASILQEGVTPSPVLTPLLFTCYRNGVINKKSLHGPRSIGDPEGLLGRPKGGRLVMTEPNLSSCRHECHHVPRVETGRQGK